MESIKKANLDEVRRTAELLEKMKSEINSVFFGHDEIIRALLRALICNGHVLIEGVPGIAKTLLIKALSKVSGCTSKRIQFTVDLLPTDILGLTTYNPKKGFEIIKGPIFANFIIADEINRAPPKTQSALIEAMQEEQVTIGKKTFQLPKPFFVMANQNPIETEGVYNLPEAQIDRFLMKIIFNYPDEDSEKRLMGENVTFKKFEDIKLKSLATTDKIEKMQKLVHKIYLDEKIKDYILKVVKKTRSKDFKYGEYIELGASPRGSISLFHTAKAEALLSKRNYVVPKDVQKVLPDILRHRIILSYRAQAAKISSDDIIKELLKAVPAP